ncbi:hypothetical protein [Stieleria magnilauensis]|uniref:hypothetical protein n=1 Tax=Stieleria magnilauensis TaxID=2527963 RepID=UPI003AF89D98
MFTRFLLIVVAALASGTAHAGVLVFSDGPSVEQNRVGSLDVAPVHDHQVVRVDKDDPGMTCASSTIVTQVEFHCSVAGFIPSEPPLSVSSVIIANSVLPCQPYGDGLLKPA